MTDTPNFLADLLGRDAGRGIAQPDRCITCKQILIPGNHAEGQCFNCAWGGGKDSPWRWAKGEQHSVGELGKYRSPTLPFSHQIKGQLLSRGAKNFAQIQEFGCGKSKTLIDEWSTLLDNREVNDLLVVAPAGVYLGWQKELNTHLPPDTAERSIVVPWYSSGTKAQDRGVTLMLACTDRPRVFLMNAEALSSVDSAVRACQTFLSAGRAVMVIDESTLARNIDAQRTQAVISLGHQALYRRIATGLPTPRSPLDLFGQYFFLDWKILGFQSFWGFKARYAVERKMTLNHGEEGRGRSFKVIVGFRNLPELREKIAPVSFRVTKDECLDLPPKLYERRDVHMTKEQTRIYEELRKNATVELSEMAHATATDVMTRRLRLLQVAAGFVVDELGNQHSINSKRMNVLKEMLTEVSGKAIIYAPWIILLRELYQELSREWPGAVVRFWGEVGTKEREESIRRFQEDPTCRFIIGNPAAMGRGRTLTAASLIVYYANGDDLEIRLNSEDRPHRIGLDHPLTIVDLVSPGTVQERQLASFRAKMDMAAVVMGEGPRNWLI